MAGLPSLGLSMEAPLLARAFLLALHARLQGPLLLGIIQAEALRLRLQFGLLPGQVRIAPLRAIQTLEQIPDLLPKLLVLVPFPRGRSLRGSLPLIGTLLFPLFQGKSSLGLHSDLDGLRQQTNRAQDPLADARQRARPLRPRL